jgi:hypothetical protein
MTPEVIHEAIAHGRISEEQGAKLLEKHYGIDRDLVRFARRARLKRWLRRVLTLGWWR